MCSGSGTCRPSRNTFSSIWFADEAALTARREEQSARARERRMQDAVLAIREKYGKNAILKAMSLRDGATARQRNEQIGGHKA